MNGPQLFDSMFADDTDGQTLKEMPGVDEILAVYPFYETRFLSL